MVINLMLIGGWVLTIAIFGFGFYYKERREERKRKKITEEIWLMR